jgi:hypothetical protein
VIVRPISAQVDILQFSTKYPIATLAHLLNILPEGLGLGYDIACSFTSTVNSSSISPEAGRKAL